MPLDLLVPSILRLCPNSQTTETSLPLHVLLDSILLTVRSVSNKYHVELPQILSDGGGAGEMEEEMMWFSLNHEKGEQGGERLGGNDIWADEKWRSRWLERLERRELGHLSFCSGMFQSDD